MCLFFIPRRGIFGNFCKRHYILWLAYFKNTIIFPENGNHFRIFSGLEIRKQPGWHRKANRAARRLLDGNYQKLVITESTIISPEKVMEEAGKGGIPGKIRQVLAMPSTLRIKPVI